MKTMLSVLLACLFCGAAFAQISYYDLNAYRPRYDERPVMSIKWDGFSYNNAQKGLPPDYAHRLSIPFGWRTTRNQDQSYRQFSLNESIAFDFNDKSFSWQNRTLASWTNLQYRDNQLKFGTELGLNNDYSKNKPLNVEPDYKDRIWSAGISADVFLGKGRIEFAEDALLSTWIFEDLLEAGVISQASSEEIESLARVITSTIGRRVFDNRRLRIFELKQLNDFFVGNGLKESFDLFAVLNDNWGFAQRLTLPTGTQFRYGVSGNLALLDRFKNSSPDIDFQIRNNSMGLYSSWVNGRMIQTNRSVNQTIRTGIDYDIEYIVNEGTFFSTDNTRTWAVPHASWERSWTWYPNSRVMWQAFQRIRGSYRIPLSDSSLPDVELPGSEISVVSQTAFSMRYLFNYNWSLEASASIRLRGNYLENDFYGGYWHSFSLETTYFIR
ncbi:MAG TPA: hypothetical protein PKA00_11445 [Saprospiraceae bacterium]|nr:hypothetical protein [Saprospiraceae bacterium]HMQ83517.1 hypothetical protein [Saprospiraceae bacterium]